MTLKRYGKAFKWFIVIAAAIYAVLYVSFGPGWSVSSAFQRRAVANLGTIRSGLSIYYGDNGFYPASIEALAVDKKYIRLIPRVELGRTERRFGISVPRHPDSSRVTHFLSILPDDHGGWGYVRYSRIPAENGKIFINCTHTDLRGKRWCDY